MLAGRGTGTTPANAQSVAHNPPFTPPFTHTSPFRRSWVERTHPALGDGVSTRGASRRSAASNRKQQQRLGNPVILVLLMCVRTQSGRGVLGSWRNDHPSMHQAQVVPMRHVHPVSHSSPCRLVISSSRSNWRASLEKGCACARKGVEWGWGYVVTINFAA